jgi:hypothetical protein
MVRYLEAADPAAPAMLVADLRPKRRKAAMTAARIANVITWSNMVPAEASVSIKVLATALERIEAR